MDKKVDDIEVLDTIIEKGAKGAVIKLKEINEELNKDISQEKMISLLIEQRECIIALQKYFDEK